MHKLNEDLEACDVEIQEKEAEKQINLRQIENLEKQAEAITAEKDAQIADLLQQLEVARAASKQVSIQQQNTPEGNTDLPLVPMISPHCDHSSKGAAEGLPPEGENAQSCAPSATMGVGPD